MLIDFASLTRHRAWALGLLVGAVAACGSSGSSTATLDGSIGDTASGTDGSVFGFDTGNPTDAPGLAFDTGPSSGFLVDPSASQTLTVPIGQTSPTLTYSATFNGVPAKAGWAVDQGSVGSVSGGPSTTTTFTPSGTTGGMVNLSAAYSGVTLKRSILVKLSGQQNGPNGSAGEAAQIAGSVGQLSAGGGIGGVGGEGLGPATDAPTQAALAAPTSDGSSQGLALLYPYDKTVWPRGMLAPLLMWTWTPGDADAIQIQLTSTTGSFSWTGTFGRPAILAATGGSYVRAPIPQDIWDIATNTVGGSADQLTVSLTVAKGGVAYGPISETWTIAPARLTGTVYYNSYGTQLVKNWVSTDSKGHPIGAAVLGVHSGVTAPSLVVGENSPLGTDGVPTNDTGCRVCHVVSSKGRWLLTQSEQGSPGDGQSYLYDLTAADVQGSVVALPQQGVFGWAGLTSDGSYALTNEIDPSSSNPAIGTSTSSLWQFGAAPTAATLTGLPSGVSAGYPSYAPDDKFVAYVDATGSTGDVQGPLVIAAYDVATQLFSGVTTVATPASGQRIGYPVFLPDNSGLIYETETRTSQTDTVMVTRDGARSELSWLSTGPTPMPVPLAALNGSGYLPNGGNNHGSGAPATDPRSSYSEVGLDDTTLNYEPTVLPVVAGGYAWVVFTSRRLYGNQLTSVPWQSWPPDYDTTDLGQATVKKLWVAAIDLGAAPGTDPSHPAFYLPAQEILAGNSRGFFVLDPCSADGASCVSGDECCNGYCGVNPLSGDLACSSSSPLGSCSAVEDKCTTAADCCDSTNSCINGFCAISGVH